MKTHLKKSLREEPSDSAVVWNLIMHEEETYFSNLDMGLYRNSVLQRSKFLDYDGNLKNALLSLLEVCYIDANGPNNRGGLNRDPDFLQKYPAFDPNFEITPLFAPGILGYITKINENLNYSQVELKALFIDHNSVVKENRNLPLSVEMAWKKFENEYFVT